MANKFTEELDINRHRLFKDQILKLDQITIQYIDLEDDTVDFLTIFFTIFFRKSPSVEKLKGKFIKQPLGLTREEIVNLQNLEHFYFGHRSKTTGNLEDLANQIIVLTPQIRMVIKLLELIVDFIYIENINSGRLELYLFRRYPSNVRILLQDSVYGTIYREPGAYLATALGDNFIGDPNDPDQNINYLRNYYNTNTITNRNILDDILSQYNFRIGLGNSNITENLGRLARNTQIFTTTLNDEINNRLETQSEQVRQRGQLQGQLQLERPLTSSNFNNIINSTNIIQPNVEPLTSSNLNNITNSTNIIQPNVRQMSGENYAVIIFNQFLDNDYGEDPDTIRNYANILTNSNVNDAVDNYSVPDLIKILEILVKFYNITTNNSIKEKLLARIKLIRSYLVNRRPDYRITQTEIRGKLTITIEDVEETERLAEEEKRLRVLQEEQKRREEEEKQLREEEEKQIQIFYENVQELINQQVNLNPERPLEQNILPALLIARENLLKDYPNLNDVSNIMNSVMYDLSNRIIEISNFVKNQVSNFAAKQAQAAQAAVAAEQAAVAVAISNDPNSIYSLQKKIIIGTLLTIVLGSIASYFYSRTANVNLINESNVSIAIDNLSAANKTSELVALYATNPSELAKAIEAVNKQLPDIELGMETEGELSFYYYGNKFLSFAFALITVQCLTRITGKVTNIMNNPNSWFFNPTSLTTQLVATGTAYFAYDVYFSNDGSVKELAKAAITSTSVVANAVAGGVNAVSTVSQATAGLINTISEGTVQIGDKISSISESAGSNFTKYGGRLVLVIAGVSLAYIIYRAYYSNSEEERTYNLKIINDDKK